MDCSLTDSSVHGIFQARVLEWVAVFSPRGSSHPRDQTHSIPGLYPLGGGSTHVTINKTVFRLG